MTIAPYTGVIDAIYLNDNGRPTEYYKIGDSYYAASLVREYCRQHETTIAQVKDELIALQTGEKIND